MELTGEVTEGTEAVKPGTTTISFLQMEGKASGEAKDSGKIIMRVTSIEVGSEEAAEAMEASITREEARELTTVEKEAASAIEAALTIEEALAAEDPEAAETKTTSEEITVVASKMREAEVEEGLTTIMKIWEVKTSHNLWAKSKKTGRTPMPTHGIPSLRCKSKNKMIHGADHRRRSRVKHLVTHGVSHQKNIMRPKMYGVLNQQRVRLLRMFGEQNQELIVNLPKMLGEANRNLNQQM